MNSLYIKKNIFFLVAENEIQNQVGIVQLDYLKVPLILYEQE